MLETIFMWLGAGVAGTLTGVTLAWLFALTAELLKDGIHSWLVSTRNYWAISRWLKALKNKESLEGKVAELILQNEEQYKKHQEIVRNLEACITELRAQLGSSIDLDAYYKVAEGKED